MFDRTKYGLLKSVPRGAAVRAGVQCIVGYLDAPSQER